MKKKNHFRTALLIYTAVLGVMIIGVCVKLWNIFASYQKSYVLAAENANPDLVAEQVMTEYYPEQLSLLATEFINQVHECEREENVEASLAALTNGKKLSYRRQEEFNDRKPAYDILADEKIIGAVYLKQGAESDEFGFHSFIVNEKIINTEQIPLYDITIYAPQDAKVIVNDKELTKDYVIMQDRLQSMIAKKAAELTGKEHVTEQYQLEGFVQYPKVEVIYQEDKKTIEMEEDGNYHFDCLYSEQFLNDVKNMVLAVSEGYIKNTNQMQSFAEIANYFKPASQAYQNVLSVQSGLTWAGKPDQLDILDAQIVELVPYAEDVFTAKTYNKIHRLYREVSYEEEMSYEWLFVKVGNQWLVDDFAIAKN